MSETKHTNTWIVFGGVHNTVVDAKYKTLCNCEDKDVMAHIVRCVNSHDALVKALQSYRDAYDIDNRDRENHDMAKWVEIQDAADKALRDAGIGDVNKPAPTVDKSASIK